MTGDALFDAEPLRVSPAVEGTIGERMRARQAARIAAGYHPLSMDGRLRLHPAAPRFLSREAATEFVARIGPYPSCGSCVFRQQVGGHARDFPKCMWPNRPGAPMVNPPRATHGLATDVRAWFPACVDWEPQKAAT